MVDTTDIVSLLDIKAHLNVTGDADDAVLTAMLEAARGYVEGWCGPFDALEGAVPPALVHALKMYVAHLYENREASSFAASATEMPMGFFSLIDPHRLRAF